MASPDDSDRWIRRLHPSPASDIRLVCFPHAGGAASYYLPLSKSLTPGVEVLAVQYPGRQDRRREQFIDDIHRLADCVVATLNLRDDRPFAFFGHSLGATLAFEVARRLEQQLGAGPALLFASGRRAPSCGREETIHLRTDAGLVSELRHLGGTDQRFLDDEELLEMILPVTRADYRAIETYVYTPGPPLRCPITALIGDSDPNNAVDEAAVWQTHTSGAFELCTFAGGHFFLDAHRADVVRIITTSLARVVPVDSVEGSLS
jgi:surfactin synthase thioesterase subunit